MCVKKVVFDGDYTKQKANAANALWEGGLKVFKRLDGKNITKTEAKKLAEMCRDRWGIGKFEVWLQENKIF